MISFTMYHFQRHDFHVMSFSDIDVFRRIARSSTLGCFRHSAQMFTQDVFCQAREWVSPEEERWLREFDMIPYFMFVKVRRLQSAGVSVV
jgi:hypothetical protein